FKSSIVQGLYFLIDSSAKRRAANKLLTGRRTVMALVLLTLFGAACLGYPSRSGYNTPDVYRSQAWDALHFYTSGRKPTQFVAQRHLGIRFQRQPGIVLSDIDPIYLNALLPTRSSQLRLTANTITHGATLGVTISPRR